ncbi:unnamed protein product [Caenorhabditis brenneri]
MVDTMATFDEMALAEFLKKTENATEWVQQEQANLPVCPSGKDVKELEKQLVIFDKLFNILISPTGLCKSALNFGQELMIKKLPFHSLIHLKIFELEQHMMGLQAEVIKRRNKFSLLIGEVMGDQFATKVEQTIQVMGFYENLVRNVTYSVDEPITKQAIIEHYIAMLELPKISRTVKILRRRKTKCLIEEYSLKTFNKLEPNSIRQDSQDMNLAIETLSANMEETYNDFRKTLSLNTKKMLTVLKQQGLLNSAFEHQAELWKILRIELNDKAQWLQEHEHFISSTFFYKFLDQEPNVSEVEDQIEKHKAFEAEHRVYSNLIDALYESTQLTFDGDSQASVELIQKAEELWATKKLSQMRVKRRKIDLKNVLAMTKTLRFLEKAQLVKAYLDETLEMMNSYSYGTDKASSEKQYELLLDYHQFMQIVSTDYMEKLDRITADCKVEDPNSNVPAAVQQRLNENDLSDFEKAVRKIIWDEIPRSLQFECEAYLNWFCDDDIGQNFYEQQGPAIDKVINVLKEKHSNIMKQMVSIFKNFAYLGRSFDYLPEVNEIGKLIAFLEADSTATGLLEYYTKKDGIPRRISTLFDAFKNQKDTPVFNRAQVEDLSSRWSALVRQYDAKIVIFKKQLHEKSVVTAQQNAESPRQPEAAKRRGRPRKQ